MTSNPIDTATAVRVCTLLEFSWGLGPTVRRYARYTSDVVVGGNTYTACPVMEVDYKDFHGGSKDETIEILIDKDVDPVLHTIGSRFPPLTVSVLECDPSNAVATLRKRFKGLLFRTVSNPNGKVTIAKLIVQGLKYFLSARTGIVVDVSCPYAFGDKACKVSLATVTSSVTISSISGNVVNLSGVPTKPDRYYQRGKLTYDGYSILIRDWRSATPSQVILMTPPPAFWSGKTASLTAGCDKTSNTCLNRHANLENFGGMGKGMQDRNPLTETGSS